MSRLITLYMQYSVDGTTNRKGCKINIMMVILLRSVMIIMVLIKPQTIAGYNYRNFKYFIELLIMTNAVFIYFVLVEKLKFMLNKRVFADWPSLNKAWSLVAPLVKTRILQQAISSQLRPFFDTARLLQWMVLGFRQLELQSGYNIEIY